ncbi:diacylglycerol kinase [Francisella noatunensis]
MLLIYAEIINRAIERVVDLVTTDYHILAKKAKDAGSALVFVSFVIELIVSDYDYLSEFLSLAELYKSLINKVFIFLHIYYRVLAFL